MTSTTAASVILVPGPWQHRMVTAAGARFHLVTAGDGPLVILLHTAGQYWWAWRHQIEPLAAAGYRVAALDLRGYGGSDKPPDDEALTTLVADVAAVIRGLGATEAVIVGHGLGGQVAWAMTGLAAHAVSAIAVISSPHPAQMWPSARKVGTKRLRRLIRRFQGPFSPHRLLTRPQAVGHYLRTGSTPEWENPEVDRFAAAMNLPAVARSTCEQLRWLTRRRRGIERRILDRALALPTTVPVLSIYGNHDGFISPRALKLDRLLAGAHFDHAIIEEAGHFLPEQDPAATNEILIAWLDDLTAENH